jgi:hypothetical protein
MFVMPKRMPLTLFIVMKDVTQVSVSAQPSALKCSVALVSMQPSFTQYLPSGGRAAMASALQQLESLSCLMYVHPL